MCDCIDVADRSLASEGQALNATLFEPRRALVSLIRTDKWTIETRRRKPTYMVATFCPICGTRYTPEPTP